jgi:hypothetical protein
MGQAVPCRVCGKLNLKWKTWNEEEWWIHCDSCGNKSDPKPTMAEAGEQWNKEQNEDEQAAT